MNLWEIDWFERNNGVATCFTLVQQMMDQERQLLDIGQSRVPADYLLVMPRTIYQEMNERGHEEVIRKVVTEALTDFMRGRGYTFGGRELLLVFAPDVASDFDCETLIKARLTVIAGREATDSFTDLRFDSQNVLIGRKVETSAIPIPASFNKVSREHLRFSFDVARRRFTMENLSERSITEINQKAIEPHQLVTLEDNSKIVIGADEHALMFHWTHRFARLAK
jgi:hypothetical protein